MVVHRVFVDVGRTSTYVCYVVQGNDKAPQAATELLELCDRAIVIGHKRSLQAGLQVGQQHWVMCLHWGGIKSWTLRCITLSVVESPDLEEEETFFPRKVDSNVCSAHQPTDHGGTTVDAATGAGVCIPSQRLAANHQPTQ